MEESLLTLSSPRPGLCGNPYRDPTKGKNVTVNGGILSRFSSRGVGSQAVRYRVLPGIRPAPGPKRPRP